MQTKNDICPLCNNKIEGYPALSRIDNETKICSDCGRLEAIENYKYVMKKMQNNRQ